MRNFVRALSALVFVIAWTISFTARAETDRSARGDVNTVCRVIADEMHNCACVVSFLREHLGAAQALLLLQAWAAYSGRLGDQSEAFAALYRDHSADGVLDASISFLKVRTEFLTRCQSSQEFFGEGEILGTRPEPDF